MPRELFHDVVDPNIKVGGQKWYTVPLSILVHTLIIAAVIIIPLYAVDALPEVPSSRRGAPDISVRTGPAGAPRSPRWFHHWREGRRRSLSFARLEDGYLVRAHGLADLRAFEQRGQGREFSFERAPSQGAAQESEHAPASP